MTKEQDEVFEILNSQVSYWDGLKSEEFWQRLGIEGVIALLSILSTVSVGGAYFIFSVEINPDKQLLLLLPLLFWSAFGIYSFHNQLRLDQLNRLVRIIKLAQEPQETNGESF